MIEEGMQKIFSQKMDIFNIFKALVSNEKILNIDKNIKMSKDLIDMIDSIYIKNSKNNLVKEKVKTTSNL